MRMHMVRRDTVAEHLHDQKGSRQTDDVGDNESPTNKPAAASYETGLLAGEDVARVLVKLWEQALCLRYAAEDSAFDGSHDRPSSRDCLDPRIVLAALAASVRRSTQREAANVATPGVHVLGGLAGRYGRPGGRRIPSFRERWWKLRL